MKKKVSVNPVAEVSAFFERNGSVIMSPHDIASRTGLSVGEVNHALLNLHRNGEVRQDPTAKLWTNIGL